MARKLQRDRVSPRALLTSILTLFLTAEMVIPGLTYRLGSTLYVALTNRCNAVPLPQTRGPGFAMSSASGFVPLPAGNEPSAADVAEAVRAAFASHDIPCEVCFAGVGEPLLRLRELEAAAALISSEHPHDLVLRVNTNGLVPTSEALDTAARLRAAGVSAATVALATANADQYVQLMKPEKLRYSPVFSLSLGLSEVQGFVRACVDSGLAVECTAVEAPDVDIQATANLAAQLGATFRARKWFPAVERSSNHSDGLTQ